MNTAAQHFLLGKRRETVDVEVDGRVVQIRDHKPLIAANLELLDGCTFDDFVNELNSKVFLWAGTEQGPCTSGKNHIRKYQAEGSVVILRVPTQMLLAENGLDRFKVTYCNSGSARQNKGQKAKRGKSTFLSLSEAARPPGDLVELTYHRFAKLPSGTQHASSLSGPWSTLKTDA